MTKKAIVYSVLITSGGVGALVLGSFLSEVVVKAILGVLVVLMVIITLVATVLTGERE